METKAKHTPGPWAPDGTRILDTNSKLIAQVLLANGMPDEELIANRGLIASAPDLLAACQDAKSTLEALCGESESDELVNRAPFVLDTIRKLQDAIAKATE
jgi:hypothetical protein